MISTMKVKKLEVYIKCKDPIVTLRKLQTLFLHDFVANEIVLEKDYVS